MRASRRNDILRINDLFCSVVTLSAFLNWIVMFQPKLILLFSFVSDNVPGPHSNALRQYECQKGFGREADRPVHHVPPAARYRLPLTMYMQMEEWETVRRVLRKRPQNNPELSRPRNTSARLHRQRPTSSTQRNVPQIKFAQSSKDLPTTM